MQIIHVNPNTQGRIKGYLNEMDLIFEQLDHVLDGHMLVNTTLAEAFIVTMIADLNNILNELGITPEPK
jgi:hypothetical protein